MEATCLQNITLVRRASYLEVLASEQLGKRGMVVDDSRGIFDGCYGDGQRKIRGRAPEDYLVDCARDVIGILMDFGV
jgi:hypothetical protein